MNRSTILPLVKSGDVTFWVIFGLFFIIYSPVLYAVLSVLVGKFNNTLLNLYSAMWFMAVIAVAVLAFRYAFVMGLKQ
jgi:hypothetical protein